MNQRIRSCTNSTNFDTINCDSYSTRLMTRDKPVAKFKRECSLAKPPVVELLPATSKSKTQPQSSKHKSVNGKDRNSKSALVEVTVRTHSEVQNRAPWNALLKSTKSLVSSPFDQFDPFHTIHFLAKELQSKCRNDPHIVNMVVAMQEALDRISPDMSSSSVLLKRSKSEVPIGKSRIHIDNGEEHPEKLVLGPPVSNKVCQTLDSLTYTDSEIFQRKLESSTAKLETSCKQMDILCEQLKNEKKYVEGLLQTETNKVLHLKQQLEKLQNDKKEFSNAAFDKLVQERQELELQLQQLKTQVNAYHGPTVQDLKTRIQELQAQKITLEQENITLRHKVAAFDMEREKHITLLNMRDKHINEILNEMNCLQEVLSEQVFQMQKAPLISSPSSQSTMLDKSSAFLLDVNFMSLRDSKEDLALSDQAAPWFFQNSKNVNEARSGGKNVSEKASQNKTKSASSIPQGNMSRQVEREGNTKRSNLTNVNELFYEVKQQAMSISVPQISENRKDQLPCDSETSFL